MNKKWIVLSVFSAIFFFTAFAQAAQDGCIQCHGKNNPAMVEDWEKSTMAKSGMDCADCHGRNHTNKKNADQAIMPSIKVCGKCHEKQAKGFSMGKHGKAEEALFVSAMGKKVRTQSSAVFDRSCATCHNEICKDGGQCDACHTGHRFSAKEARKPESCLPCHLGNHPQYESYSCSKHGALYKSRGLDDSVPTCTTCHMPEGDHMVKTSWGFFGVRGEEPDPKLGADQKIVKTAVEMLGPILAPDSFRSTMVEWTERREAMLDVCVQCHAKSSARKDLEAGDAIVAQANHLATGFINAAGKLKEDGQCSPKEYFWLIRDKMHAQRMSMYISAFHQHPEGVLLEMIHFKRATMEIEKNISENH